MATKKKKEYSVFDKRDLYETKVKPLSDELVKMCSILNIPVYVCIATKNDEDGTMYEQDGVPAYACRFTLQDDWFTKFINIGLGFETIRKEEISALRDPDAYTEESIRDAGHSPDSDEFVDNADAMDILDDILKKGKK